jgi:hypothetical protein
MNKLPIEIENNIWNLYYMDIFKNNCLSELKDTAKLCKDIEDIKEALFKFLRIYRFNDVCNEFTIDQIIQHKISFKENCLKLEEIFKFLNNKKVFWKILDFTQISNSYNIVNNNYHKYKLMKSLLNKLIEKKYLDKYYFTIKFILYKCNYQKKLISRLKFLLS